MAQRDLHTRYGKHVRIDTGFAKFLNETVPVERVKKGLEKKTIGSREVTRMIMNSESLPFLLKELTTKPRKKII